MKNMRAKKIISVIFGNTLIGVVVGVMSFLKVGTDVFTGMNLGISAKLGMELGYLQLIMNLIILVYVFLNRRDFIGFGTVVNMVIIGFIVQAVQTWMEQFAFINDIFWLRMTLMMAGIILLCIALAFYLSPNMGMSPYDAIAYILYDKWKGKIQYRYIRMTQDVTTLVIGFLLGTTIGPFTFVASFLLGPLIQFFRTHMTDKLFYVNGEKKATSKSSQKANCT